MAATIPKDPEKMQRILTSATHNFAKFGYHGTKTDVIANEADVSKGIIFRYFGDKGHLFLAVIKRANDFIINIADYSVWQDATDFVDMIGRATKYKIELQLKYPDEFSVLLRGYVGEKEIPTNIMAQIHGLFNVDQNTQIVQLIKPVLKKLPIREDVDEETIFAMVSAVMSEIEKETRVFMTQHPQATLEQFNDIITHAQSYVAIIERGITK
ncbi:TetR/AcrR family transcriptional regulator [Paucilactobacillus sp. N302-9]